MVCFSIGWPNRTGTLVCLLIFLLAHSACETSRKTVGKPFREESPELLFQKLSENELSWETLSAKFSADYDDGKNRISVTGHLRLKCDSIIWLSLSPALGIEILRIVLTKDSVKILDRMQSVGLLQDYGYFNHWIGGMLDFDMLQSLIVGNDFVDFDQGNIVATKGKDHYRLELRDRSKSIIDAAGTVSTLSIPLQYIWLSPEQYKIMYTAIMEIQGDDPIAEASYHEFKLTDSQSFPRQVSYVIGENDNRLKVDIDYLRVNLNESLNFPFFIPKRYTRIPE